MPLLRFYALITIVLSLKMSAIAFVQGRARTGEKKFAIPEDAKLFGGEVVAQEVAGVQRAANAWRNDLENIPIFLILALVYVMAGLSASMFVIYSTIFVIARILHTVFYIRAIQPWRTIVFTIGAAAMFALIIHLTIGFVIVGGD